MKESTKSNAVMLAIIAIITGVCLLTVCLEAFADPVISRVVGRRNNNGGVVRIFGSGFGDRAPDFEFWAVGTSDFDTNFIESADLDDTPAPNNAPWPYDLTDWEDRYTNKTPSNSPWGPNWYATVSSDGNAPFINDEQVHTGTKSIKGFVGNGHLGYGGFIYYDEKDFTEWYVSYWKYISPVEGYCSGWDQLKELRLNSTAHGVNASNYPWGAVTDNWGETMMSGRWDFSTGQRSSGVSHSWYCVRANVTGGSGNNEFDANTTTYDIDNLSSYLTSTPESAWTPTQGATWARYEYYVKASSAAATDDGYIQIRCTVPASDEVWEWTFPNADTTESAVGNGTTYWADYPDSCLPTNPGPSYRRVVWQDTAGSDGTCFGAWELWTDDIYMAASNSGGVLARVELANSEVYAEATHVEVQPIDAWGTWGPTSEDYIDIEYNTGSFDWEATTGSQVLWIIDENGTRSVNGWDMINQTIVSEPPPPKIYKPYGGHLGGG